MTAEDSFANVWFDLAPDGDTLVFSSANGELFRCSLVSPTRKRFMQTPPGIAYAPKFSRDGKSLTFCLQQCNNKAESYIAVCAADDSSAHLVTNSKDIWDTQPSFSPDGSHIAFVRWEGNRPYAFGGTTWERANIFTVCSDGTDLKPVTEGRNRRFDGPVFFPSGDLIFSDMNGYPPRSGIIYRVPAGSANPPQHWYTPACKNEVYVHDLSLSFDGQRLAFVGNTNPDPNWTYTYDVNLLDIATNTLKPLGLCPVTRENRCPVFSPDGDSIYYLGSPVVSKTARFSLWRINLATRKTEEVLKPSFFE